MVLISRKVDYAILALSHLMKLPTGCSAREVAARYNLSRPFLANILKELCHHGFIESHRGINGGYRLSRVPSEVTLEEIVGALDGPFQLMSCASGEDVEACGLMEFCPVKGPLRIVHDRMLQVLRETTLADLGAHEMAVVPLHVENAENADVSHLPG